MVSYTGSAFRKSNSRDDSMLLVLPSLITHAQSKHTTISKHNKIPPAAQLAISVIVLLLSARNLNVLNARTFDCT